MTLTLATETLSSALRLRGDDMAKYQEILDAINELNKQFGRIDERTRNIWTLTEKQEGHLSKLNDSMMKHAAQISSNRTSIRWIIRIASGLIIIGGTATGLVSWLG